MWRVYNSSSGVPYNCVVDVENSERNWQLNLNQDNDNSFISAQLKQGSSRALELKISCRTEHELRLQVNHLSVRCTCELVQTYSSAALLSSRWVHYIRICFTVVPL